MVAMIRCSLHWHAFKVRFKAEADATFVVAQLALATAHRPGMRLVRMIVRQDVEVIAGLGWLIGRSNLLAALCSSLSTTIHFDSPIKFEH